MPSDKKADAGIGELLDVMAALRTPGTGCSWDLEQTFKTIAPYTIEEAYEVAEAIEKADFPALKDELGDLLLQVVYHARMAEEQGAFAFDDVVGAITAKMIRRHPHVFGSAEERAAGPPPGSWERIKAAERSHRAGQEQLAAARTDVGARGGPEEGSAAASVLDGIPAGLPALTRAIKLQQKAAGVGFDWPSLEPVFAKLREEIEELERALAMGETSVRMRGIEDELGDLLFVTANLARHLQLDPEAALRAANQKFIRRFHAIERKLAARGLSPTESDLAEMDCLWENVKREEKGSPRS